MGMTSGIADYDDFFMEHFTFKFAGDDAGPFLYLKRCKARSDMPASFESCVLWGQLCALGLPIG